MKTSAVIVLPLGMALSVSGLAFAGDSPWSSSGVTAVSFTSPNACQDCSGTGWVATCPAGDDTLETSRAEFGIYPALDTNCDGDPRDFVLFGSATVHRKDPTGTRIGTEITSMELTGGGLTLVAGPGAGNSIINKSTGEIVERVGDDEIADSTFSLYFEADIPMVGKVWNHTSFEIHSVIDCVPPDADYLHPSEQCIALYDDPVIGQGNIIARLGKADHDTDPCEEPDIAPDTHDCATALVIPCNGCGYLDPASDSTPTGPLNGGDSPCASGGANDVWATFVATETNARFRTDVSGSVGTDSEFSVYAVDQADVCNEAFWTEIVCSADDGGTAFLGDVSIDGLVVGDTYLVQMGHWSDAYTGEFVLQIECPATGGICGDGVISSVPGGEECDGAETGDCLLTCEPNCTCTPVPTPMLPRWGLIGLAVLLIVGGVAIFGRARTGVQQT